MLAVDLSNYSTPLTAEAVTAWKAQGVGLAIVQAITPPAGYPAGQTAAQIQTCLDGGLLVDAYIWLWFDLDVSDIENKLALLAPFSGKLRRLWLDVEDTAAQKYDQATTEKKVRDALSACDAAPISGLAAPAGVYTGKWFWADARYLANTTSFSDRNLWDANYDGVADETSDFKPYGGWTSCVIKQYRGTSTLAAIGNVDLDVTADIAVAPVRETPDDYPFADWRQSAIAYRGALDAMGQQVDALKSQLAAATEDSAKLTDLQQRLQDADSKITSAITALGGKAA